ncbi:sideroflexin-4 isoform X1 [Conger conger]|uniref:sideroflexin-4 isoform X1 n=1 Tax=Conger conger TaxID=82655 RepID=UPI002A5A3324|nr:sideroflexin-4 isoform X1 [Conger conger]
MNYSCYPRRRANEMDINLQFWKSEGQSFLDRLCLWMDILDPVYFLTSDAEIQKARSLLRSTEDQKRELDDAWRLSLSSVHSDTGAILPTIFRPSAFFPVAIPLVLASLLPLKGVKLALLSQFPLQCYTAGFNYCNRNATGSKEKMTRERKALMAGTVALTTCAGAIPQIVMTHYGLKTRPVQMFCRTVLPAPLAALLAFFSVLVVRGDESRHGVRVFDSHGNCVGISQNAGSKAVADTALTRAALMGTTTALPGLFIRVLRRVSQQRNLWLMAPPEALSAVLALSVMIPVSFSLFPQLCTIPKVYLEPKLQAATEDQQLFYHRGL